MQNQSNCEITVDTQLKTALMYDNFQDSLKFVRNNTKEFVPTVNSNLTCSLMRILDCFFAPFVPKEVRSLK